LRKDSFKVGTQLIHQQEIPMNSKTLFFVLGASDPEMNAIEEILNANQWAYTYALVDGRRVHPGNAYRAEVNPIPEHARLVTIECGLKNHVADIALDHHQQGDAGFGKLPEHYWEGSSIGQLHTLLNLSPTQAAKITAAADHCLTAAYAGLCPGVTPDEVLALRCANLAVFRSVSEDEIQQRVAYAHEKLQKSPKICILGQIIADTRGQDIPEANEASARYAIPFLYQVDDVRSGRTKVGLMGAKQEVIAEWMKTCGLTDVYGDPARGYAGGYLA
jgi:hypothetical protein